MMKMRKLVFLLALCGALLLGFYPFESSAASFESKAPDGHYVSPITVDTSIAESTVKNEKWDIAVSVGITLDAVKNTLQEENIKLSYSLYRLSQEDEGSLSNKVKDSNIYSKKFKLKEKESNKLELKNLEEGQYQLEIQALSDMKNDERLGGRADLFFTIDSNGIREGWVNPVLNVTYGYDEKGKKLKIIDVKDKKYGNEDKKQNNKQTANSMNNLTRAATVSFNGNFKEYFRDYSSVIAVKYAKVELRYRDQFYIWRSIANTTTDGTGNFNMSYANPGGANLWELRLSAQNSYGKVVNQKNEVWTVVNQYTDLSTGGNVGNIYLPSKSEHQKAFWLYNDIVVTHNSLKTYRDPGSATIVWYPSSTESARYELGKNILLNAASAQSKTTAIHELAHNYMYNIYNNEYPTTNCSAGVHYYKNRTEVGCAWTEGWAHFLALNMNSSPIYTYTDGTQWNAENTSSYETGDAVEGRVAGALWDLRDTENDGSDYRSYLFKNIYEVMYGTKIDTFAEYWSQWKAKGFDIGAKDSIAQNSINYK